MQPEDDDEAAIEIRDRQERGEQSKEKVTTRYMTKYERARLLGTRALQIRFKFSFPFPFSLSVSFFLFFSLSNLYIK